MLDRNQSSHHTIGVLSNRQIYEGTTIVRYEQMLFRGIRAAARAYDANLLLACGIGSGMIPFERRPAWPVSLPDADFVPVGPLNTSGLIVVPPLTEVQLSLVQTWVTQGHPLVFTAPQEGYPSVGPANSAGITAAFDHLIAHGHRRIAFIAGHEHYGSDDAERLTAYRSAVVAHGLPVDNTLVAFGNHVANESYEVMRRMIEAAVEFTAVLTSNDESAIGALQALADAGKRVPQDVAVIGFDDVLYAKAQSPPLTTIRHPTFELGYHAIELLLDYITCRRTEVTTVRVPTRLIIRESCGCQPYSTVLVAARDEGKAARSVGTDFDQAALVQAMADAASAELRHDNASLISAHCWSLIGGFLTSLNDDDPQPFGTALEQILQLGDATNEDAYAWQAAVSVLREQGAALLLPDAPLATHAQAECLIDQARVRISERLRRHHIQLQMRQAKLTDRLGTLTTGLLTALEPRQILQILAEQLPQLDIRHAHIALFAAEDNDLVPWSDLYIHVPGEAPVMRRFPSRHFPPPGLYNSAEPCSLALLPLIVEGGPSGFVAFEAAYLEPCGFIARHLAAAFRNSQLHATAEAGRQLAEEASRLKSRFLATVSHELRMPLNLVVGLSEMLLREHTGSQALPQSVVQDLERIYGNAEHLGRMIGDVLDLASSEAGQLRLNREPLDLAEVLAVVAVTGAQMAQAKGLAWHTRLPIDGVQVWGDRTRLRQVVLNLISNAVKFTERGSVTLELSLADDVTVSVSDTGPGVPLQHQQQIFDEFHSSDRTMQRGYGGLGLGLTIGKHLIERHGGTLGVRSSGAEDSGSTFYFTLPRISSREPQTEQFLARAVAQPLVVPSDPDDIDDHRSTILHEPGVDLQVRRPDAKTILVVDDDPETAALNMRVIRQQLPTCRVLQASSGTEALALLEHLRPNLVLLDLVMPGLDGFGVLAAMRARAATLDVPVLVLTGRMLTEDDLARLHAGVAGILNKGLFNANEILEHIDAAVAQRRKLGSPTQQLVRRAAAFIRAHSTETLTRDQIAAYVGMSADHLTASFRQEMGVTPMAYLIRCRIESARVLLHESMRSITDVALDVGFADVANFSRAFHREVGVTPHAYRRSKRH